MGSEIAWLMIGIAVGGVFFNIDIRLPNRISEWFAGKAAE